MLLYCRMGNYIRQLKNKSRKQSEKLRVTMPAMDQSLATFQKIKMGVEPNVAGGGLMVRGWARQLLEFQLYNYTFIYFMFPLSYVVFLCFLS